MTTARILNVPEAQKTRRERIIFGLFVHASGLPIRMRSIRSRPVPEPDIRCTVGGEGPVAFELGEIVTPLFAETTNQRQPLGRRFRDGYVLLPQAVRSQIEEGLGGPPAVLIGFPAGTSPGRWCHVIPPVLSWLAEQAGQLVAGDIVVWKIPALEHILTDRIVQKTSGRAASLHVMEATEVFDETQKVLAKKFSKRYAGHVPLELVTYYISRMTLGD